MTERPLGPGDEYRIWPADRTWKLARVILQSWYAPLLRLRVYGRERLPEGAVVLASNHISGTDPVVLGMASRRPLRYMAKVELWSVPVLRRILPHTGTFPVRRGAADRAALETARRVLRAGHVLGIFVEGTRQTTDEIGAAKTGAAMCAVLEGAVIVPACLIGTDHHRRNPLHRAAVAFGTPIDVSGVPRGARGYRAVAAALEDELRSLREFLHVAADAGFPRGAVPPVCRAVVEVER